ncbi:helix-turn-helix domain-containing protein [Streptosporangium sp. DT93]|uniref:helix-turn-helix domain-containing protein n=1 Tax=Streptosporangium sp. DT93 TaxID=3393428 RepID=UPI003CF9CF60
MPETSLPGEVLRDRRRALRLTAAQLGQRAGISKTAVVKAERGLFSSSAPSYVAIRDALDAAEARHAVGDEQPDRHSGLGDQLRRARTVAGLTQDDVGDLLGRRGNAWLTGIEGGWGSITPDRLDQLAAALGCEIHIVPIGKEPRPDA